MQPVTDWKSELQIKLFVYFCFVYFLQLKDMLAPSIVQKKFFLEKSRFCCDDDITQLMTSLSIIFEFIIDVSDYLFWLEYVIDNY